MEPWPIAAWVLLLTGIADWLKMAQTRDFTIKDIVALHPSTTPHPGGVKCFTCQDAADNYECNRWAPDAYCPTGTSYCHTVHVMDMVGDSVSVSKRCVALEDCLLTGCTNTTEHAAGYQVVCTSCCEGHICNLRAPRNQRSAVFSTRSPPLQVVSSSWPYTTRLFPETFCYVFIGVITARHV